MPVEIVRGEPQAVDDFIREHEREALKTAYGFSVVWHEQRHDFAAVEGDRTLGAARIRIAASLAHVEDVVVVPERRREGIGARLLESAEQTANYYNCHKMTVTLPSGSDAQRFFERCGYHLEAILRQHTFKLDMAVLRRFLL